METFPPNAVAIAVWNSTKVNADGSVGGWDVMGGISGAALVQTDLAQGILMGKRIKAFHPREKDTLVGTAVTFDWGSLHIYGVILKPSQEGIGTAELLDSIAYVPEPVDDIFRDLALTAGTNLTGDTLRYTMRANADEVLTFNGSYLNPAKLGVIRDAGGSNLRLVAVGIEVVE